MEFNTFVSKHLFFVIITIIFLSTPAWSDTHNQDLYQENTGISQGPDYIITGVSLPPQTSWINSGSYLYPNITLSNIGEDDRAAQNIEVDATLGLYPLISRNNRVTPLKAGETRTISPDYLIPNMVPSGEYALSISIHKDMETNRTNTGNATITVDKAVNIKFTSQKAKVSNCGCS
jgi:hypothetical protein